METFGLKGTACVKRLFNTFDSDNDGKLRYKEYMKFIKKVTLRPELDTLWTMIVKNEKIRKKFKRPMELKADKTTESYDTISLGQFTTFWYVPTGSACHRMHMYTYIDGICLFGHLLG